MSKENSNKIKYLTFICSIIIIFSHSNGYKYYAMDGNSNLENFVKLVIDSVDIGLFKVSLPVFFMVTGYLYWYNVENWGDVIKKIRTRIKSLCIPYLFWNVFWMLFIASISCVPRIVSNIDSLLLFSPTIKNVFEGVLLHKYNDVYWYMLSIITLCACSPILFFIIKRKEYAVCLLIIVALLAVRGSRPCVPFVNNYFLFFYLLGTVIGVHYNNITNKRFMAVMPVWINFVLITIISVVLALYQFSTKIYMLLVVLMIMCLWRGLDIWADKKAKGYMKYTFFIYSTHRTIQQCVNKLIVMILPKYPMFALINWLGGVVITFIICICSASLIEKYTPKIWTIVNGGRVNT